MQLTFYKYQGTGNDFIILNNLNQEYTLTTEQIRHLCDRRFGIGGDGLMLLNASLQHHFHMEYYNADGRESSMCGNGGRCLVKFAHQQGIEKDKYFFTAVDGLHEAVIQPDGWVYLKMKDVHSVTKRLSNWVLDTGSPHLVQHATDVRGMDVYTDGKAIRYSNDYKEAGINVNFAEEEEDNIFVRTYERGVEDETLSCGTGVTAAALVFAHNDVGFNRVNVKTLGGKLAVEFDKTGHDTFENIWLCGPAEFVFKGRVEV